MGTHPIFESDFDCLTDRNRDATIITNIYSKAEFSSFQS